MKCTGKRPLCICSDGKTRGVAPGLTIMLGNEKTTSDENGDF